MVSLYSVHDDGSCMGSTTRWIDSRHSRWESSNRSCWEQYSSETAAADGARDLSRFETIGYNSGGAGCTDLQAFVDSGQWAPRKPLRRESLETGFHVGTESACPREFSGRNHCHNENNSKQAIVDCRTLPSSSSPRTTITCQGIRPPRKPVRQVSNESFVVPHA